MGTDLYLLFYLFDIQIFYFDSLSGIYILIIIHFLAEPKIHSVLNKNSYVDLRNKKSDKKVLPS